MNYSSQLHLDDLPNGEVNLSISFIIADDEQNEMREKAKARHR
jgi:hypothetical protein